VISLFFVMLPYEYGWCFFLFSAIGLFRPNMWPTFSFIPVLQPDQNWHLDNLLTSSRFRKPIGSFTCHRSLSPFFEPLGSDYSITIPPPSLVIISTTMTSRGIFFLPLLLYEMLSISQINVRAPYRPPFASLYLCWTSEAASLII